MIETTNYHYSRFNMSHFEGEWLPFFDTLKVGKTAPNFKVKDDRGNIVQLSDFAGKILVVETGSISCPMYLQSLPGMNNVIEEHPEVEFLLLYTRETHPGEKLPRFDAVSEKVERIKRLKREEPESRIVLTDDMPGTMHHAYGKMPNSVVVIDRQGLIAYHAQWNDAVATNEVISRLKKGKSLEGVKPKYRRPSPFLAFRTFKRAGKLSIIDFLVNLPRVLYHHWKYD